MESGERQDCLYTNTALAAGLPNVSGLTQRKIAGGTANPIYLNRSYGKANDAGRRIGQGAGYNAQIGADTQLTGHYDWDVNGRLKQLEATFPDSFGNGTPVISDWRARYEYGNAEDENLLTRLLRQRAYEVGVEDWVDSLYAYEAGLEKFLSVTNLTVIALAAGCAPIRPPVRGMETVC